MKYKVWYYDAHENVIKTDVIHCHDNAGLDVAKLLAEEVAVKEIPDCVRLEVLPMAETKTSVLEH